MLAAYAMRVEESLGRRHAEPAHPYRNDYERDRDRVIHSRAFRRLEDKTQVFTLRFSDHFRNRLTHTLEVAQISRTVARVLGLNLDLVEALALAHDIGHPPFGHAGEEVLDGLMREHGGSFDHNIHALRIVEGFEQKYLDFSGLNLTFEVREGIIKHSHDCDPALFPELAEYRLDDRPTLEAQVIDLADEIGYNCADLDDGYEAKLLTVAAMRDGMLLFDRLYRPLEKKRAAAPEKLLFNEALKQLLDALVTDLIDSTRERLRKSGARSVEDVRRNPKRLAGFGGAMGTEDMRVKDFLSARLYAHPSIRAERKKITRSLEGLFQHFLEHPRSLPASYHAKAQQEALHRIVCDYIAGMTDSYLIQQYGKYVTG
ncbi:MAG: deoxyguanosinetriphosphate triphosphohydrolase [Acidobacteria bacterium]|nr:deoxyguanosinetriphosphate triphosphohydrolase [Acidobacteriota bacterium]